MYAGGQGRHDLEDLACSIMSHEPVMDAATRRCSPLAPSASAERLAHGIASFQVWTAPAAANQQAVTTISRRTDPVRKAWYAATLQAMKWDSCSGYAVLAGGRAGER
jgi:hypothetical protein